MNELNRSNQEPEVVNKPETIAPEGEELEALEHSDLSFLLNHALDELEAEYAEEEERNFENQLDISTPNLSDVREIDTSPFSEDSEEKPDEKGEDEPEYASDFSFLEDEFKELLSKYDSEPEDKNNQTNIFDEDSESSEEFSDESATDEPRTDIEDGEPKETQETVEKLSLTESGAFHSLIKKKKFGISLFHNIFQIGLDIGTNNIKYVIARKQKSVSQIQAFGILPNPFDREEEFDKIIEYVSSEINLKNTYKNIRCTLNVNGTGFGIKKQLFPKMNAKMTREAISWSAKKDFDLEEVPAIIDYIKIGKQEKKGIEHYEYLIVGCDENIITPKLEPLLSRKIIPFKVTPLAITLWQLYKKSSVYDPDQTVALIEIGESKTTIAFIKDGILEFHREIPTAGRDITEALTGTIFYDGKPYQLSYQEAEKMKIKFGFPDEELEDLTAQGVPVPEYSVLMRPILERIGSEIQRSIDYFRENYQEPNLDHVFILGGTSQLKNFMPFLSSFIEQEMSIFPFSKEKQQSLSEEDLEIFQSRSGEFAIAYSLATDCDSHLNLLPSTIKKLDKFNLIRRLTIYGFFVLASLIGLSSAFSFFNVATLRDQFQLLQLEFSKLDPLKRQFDALQQKQVYLSNKKNIYRKELKLDNPLPVALKVISNLYPKEMSVTNITVTNKFSSVSKKTKKKSDKKEPQTGQTDSVRIIRIHGVCYSPRADAGIKIAEYLRKLKKTGIFRNITVTNQDFLQEFDQLKFEIVGEID